MFETVDFYKKLTVVRDVRKPHTSLLEAYPQTIYDSKFVKARTHEAKLGRKTPSRRLLIFQDTRKTSHFFICSVTAQTRFPGLEKIMSLIMINFVYSRNISYGLRSTFSGKHKFCMEQQKESKKFSQLTVVVFFPLSLKLSMVPSSGKVLTYRSLKIAKQISHFTIVRTLKRSKLTYVRAFYLAIK